MTLKQPIGMQAGGGDTAISYSALDIREIFDAFVQGEGVAGLTSLKVSQRGAGANFSVDVAVGYAVIIGDDVALQGKYLVQNTAAYNVTIPAAPGSGSRIHRIIARIKDKLHNGTWTTYEWTIECLADVGSGTPALPNSAISLALVTVAAAQASVLDANIADVRPTALMLDSLPLVVASDAERPDAPYTGQRIYRSDKPSCFEVWNGTAWVLDAAAATLYKSKPSDTSGTSNTTLGDDPHLTVTLAAGAEYWLDLSIIYSAHSSGDLKIGFSYPSGGGANLTVMGQASAATGTTGDGTHLSINSSSDTVIVGGASAGNTEELCAYAAGHVYSGVGGAFTFRWAQGTSSATATIVRAWSSMILRRMT